MSGSKDEPVTALVWKAKWDTASKQICSSHPKLDISIFHPEVVGTMLKKHVEYTVRTEQLGYTVRRRFSEFVLLREILLKSYQGLFIPSLPTDSIFSGNIVSGTSTDIDSDFIRNRTVQLNFFMNQICNIPFLMTSQAFKTFLSMQDEFKTIESINTTAAYDSSPNEGEMTWKFLIDSCSIPNNHDRIINDMKRQLLTLKSCLRHLLDECIILNKIAITYTKQLKTIHDKSIIWNAIEIDITDSTKNEAPIRIPNLTTHLKATLESFRYWTKSTQNSTKLSTSIIMACIQFQLIQIDGFQEFLKHRDVLFNQLEKLEKEKSKLMDDQITAATSSSSGSSSGNHTSGTSSSPFGLSFLGKLSSSSSDLGQSIIKKEEQISALAISYNTLTKAILFCEYERLHVERCQSIRNLVGCMSAAHSQESAEADVKWREIATSSGLQHQQDDEFSQQVNMMMKLIIADTSNSNNGNNSSHGNS